MKSDQSSWTKSLRTAILIAAVVEAIGIALGVWNGIGKGWVKL